MSEPRRIRAELTQVKWTRRCCQWLLLTLVLVGAMGSCAVVKPWQRGRLGHPAMQMEGAPGSSQRPQLLSIREGSVGGEGGAGGGCGCN